MLYINGPCACRSHLSSEIIHITYFSHLFTNCLKWYNFYADNKEGKLGSLKTMDLPCHSLPPKMILVHMLSLPPPLHTRLVTLLKVIYVARCDCVIFSKHKKRAYSPFKLLHMCIFLLMHIIVCLWLRTCHCSQNYFIYIVALNHTLQIGLPRMLEHLFSRLYYGNILQELVLDTNALRGRHKHIHRVMWANLFSFLFFLLPLYNYNNNG